MMVNNFTLRAKTYRKWANFSE